MTDTLEPESAWGEPITIANTSLDGNWTYDEDQDMLLDPSDDFNITDFSRRTALSTPKIRPGASTTGEPLSPYTRKIHHKSLDQYKRDNWHNETLRRSSSCVGFNVDLPDIGIKLAPQYCHDEKFEFSMEVDHTAIVKL